MEWSRAIEWYKNGGISIWFEKEIGTISEIIENFGLKFVLELSFFKKNPLLLFLPLKRNIICP